ncbi:MAG TPA: hypothetical protein VJ437_13455 [Acidiferrobacterales bacterium]|mgnify:CR=1 FL=1|nr:hypothetical protein [Acidiferrobacterales bacterium]
MKFPLNRRWLILGALLVGTVVAAVVLDQGDRAESESISVASASAGKKTESAAPVIDLEKLKRPAARTDVVNVLGSKTWYVPPPPPKPLPPPPPPPPEAPPLPFVYMGKLQEGGGHLVFFLVKGDRVYTVRAGDVIDATYKVEGVSGGKLTLTYLPLNIQQTLTVGDVL